MTKRIHQTAPYTRWNWNDPADQGMAESYDFLRYKLQEKKIRRDKGEEEQMPKGRLWGAVTSMNDQKTRRYDVSLVKEENYSHANNIRSSYQKHPQ